MTYTYFRPQHQDITEEMWTQIDRILEENKDTPGAVTQVLRQCQEVVGWLPRELMDYIAWILNVPACNVFGIATFYSLFSLQPKGKHVIKACTGTACYVKGIKEVLGRLEQVYGLKDGDTTEDRKFTLESLRCVGACGLAPAMLIDNKTYGTVTPEKVLNILKEYE
ncbi:MAG: NADH-quinone oxidoreductase subunit NuoE [Desulfovermiculus sp.]